MAKRVLMIDDDPEFVDAITNLLDAKGYDVDMPPMVKTALKKQKPKNRTSFFLTL